MLAYFIAGCVAHGNSVLGRATIQSKVLYLDGENPHYLVHERLRDLGIAPTSNLITWGGWDNWPPGGPGHPLVVEFARITKGLIISDSLIEFHEGSEQSSTDTRMYMRYYRALANLGATVLILHNAGKSEGAKLYRGSSDIKAAVDTAYALTRPENQSEDVLEELAMTSFKARLAPGQTFGMKYVKGKGFVPHHAKASGVATVIVEILRTNGALNQGQIIALASDQGITKQACRKCLKDGPWKKTSGPKNSITYDLPDDACEVDDDLQ